MIHGDVKPGNVLLDSAGHAYLAHFSLTKDVGLANDVTGSGRVIGTVDYMPPEQIRGEAIDARSDVDTLGYLLFSPSPALPTALDAVIGRLAMARDERFEAAGALARGAIVSVRSQSRV